MRCRVVRAEVKYNPYTKTWEDVTCGTASGETLTDNQYRADSNQSAD